MGISGLCFYYSRYNKLPACFDNGNEYSGFASFGYFPEWLGNCQLLNEDFVSFSTIELFEYTCKYEAHVDKNISITDLAYWELKFL